MNGVEDLLRQALLETPTPTSDADPIAELDRRVQRARRRFAVGGAVAAAAIVAAVVVPLSTVGTGGGSDVQIGGHPTPTTHATAPAHATPDVWLNGGAHGVATFDLRGHSFVVAEHGNGATRRLLELDGQGKTVRTYTLPGSALFVAHRDSTLWVWGGGDGAYPDSEITRLTVGSHDNAATLSLGRGQAVESLAITERGDAWAVTVDQVVHLAYRAGAVRVVERIPLAGAQRIVTTSEGQLWVQADTRLVQLVPGGDPGGRTAQVSDVHWAGTLFAAGGSRGDSLWVQDGPRRVVLFEPLVGPHGFVSSPIRLPGRPTAVAEDGIGGVYVALQGGGVAFYDFATVPNGGPPTAVLPRDAVEVETMAATLDGGLLMQDFGGQVLHWKPPTS